MKRYTEDLKEPIEFALLQPIRDDYFKDNVELFYNITRITLVTEDKYNGQNIEDVIHFKNNLK